MEIDLYVTTAHKFDSESVAKAIRLSENLKVPYLERKRKSLAELRRLNKEAGFLVVNKEGDLTLVFGEKELFFHPSMSKVRIKSLKRGNNDPMLTAMGLKTGDHVLDCTLGLGSDAIIASYAVGPKGRVTGIETVPALAVLVGDGLKCYQDKNMMVNEAMRRIEVVNTKHLKYLKLQPDKSIDIVYFDPMFRKPVLSSSSMEPMREWVNYEPLTTEAIEEAKRVARNRVVMKEASNSLEFERLGFSAIHGGKHSPVAYGIIFVD